MDNIFKNKDEEEGDGVYGLGGTTITNT